jgi:serine protease Do
MRLPRIFLPVLALTCFLFLTWSWLFAQDAEPRAFATQSGKAKEPPRGKLLARRTPIVELVERVKGAVVNIHSERVIRGQAALDSSGQEFLGLTPSQNRVNGMGTGIVIDQRGYIVTNYHVVEDVNFIRVKLADGTTANAEVLARSHDQDLALLKIETSQPLPVMPIGTAQDLMVGEAVVAIGNAFGYEHTVSYGIVSAIKRDVTLNKDIAYKSLIQTDASINPGNSGGPLLNVHGELVGVNVAIRAGAQGIGFAIPVDTMVRVVGEMLRSRRRQFAFDGLVVRDRLESTSEGMMRSVVVERIEPGSPAASANLQVGDIITRLGDMTVLCSFDVDRALLDRGPRETVPMVVRRQSQETKTELVLQSTGTARGNTAEVIWRKMGVRLTPLPGEVVSRADSRLRGGMEIVQVNPGGAADKAGVKRGDILVGLHQYETVSLDNVAYVLNSPELRAFMPLKFLLLRAGEVKPMEGYIQQLDQ